MQTVIIIVLVLLLLSLVTEKISAQPKENEMTPNTFGYFTAWLGFAIGLFPIAQVLLGNSDVDTWIGLAILTPGGFWGFLHLLTLRYKFDENGIEVKSLVSMVNAGAWKHFQSAYHSPKSYAHILEFSFGDIRVYDMFKNKKQFLDFMESKGFETE